MKLYYISQLIREDLKRLCLRPWSADKSIRETVASLCLDVKQRGDDALREYSKRFDAMPVSDFRVTPAEIENARDNAPGALVAAIEHAARNIRAFHAAQTRTEPRIETEPGVLCWRQQRAIETVGLYIPAGSAPLPSTVLMLGIPAILAGSSRIVLCSPPKSNGSIDPAVLATAAYLGIREIYKIGGAQAIAAMAYGTQSIPKVEKILGPGNQYVTEAKRFVSSDTDGAAIDLLAGPSELLIIADDSAQPAIVAADLLSQAEHDFQSQVVLLTTSESLAQAALDEVRQQLELLPRKEIAAESLDKSYAIVVQSIEEAVSFSNMYAPEHLLINTREPEALVPEIRNAGSVFLGAFAPVTAGDYASGTNHTLPTGGSARWVSGVSVDSFQKSMTFQSITREGLLRLSPALTTLAQTEGLEAHARAVTQRLEE
ncbi:MAG: histidinol dehydrogenase [Ignavibacteriales bacterium]|nr:histidinol dehydrogenase [Ignavibacteriales bacterium]